MHMYVHEYVYTYLYLCACVGMYTDTKGTVCPHSVHEHVFSKQYSTHAHAALLGYCDYFTHVYAALLRAAHLNVRSSDEDALSKVEGYSRHSSSTMTMSEPRRV
jgi:hypothetical protein